MDTLKNKILGVLILIGAAYLLGLMNENFMASTVGAIFAAIVYFYFQVKRFKLTARAIPTATHKEKAAKSILWGVIFLSALVFFIYDDALFSVQGTSHEATIVKSTPLTCTFTRRKSSTVTESECWDVDFVVEGKNFQRRVYYEQKKGETFNVNTIDDSGSDMRYEEPIDDRFQYFADKIHIFEVVVLIIALYKIIFGFVVLALTGKVKDIAAI
jgi:hypothetical protein